MWTVLVLQVFDHKIESKYENINVWSTFHDYQIKIFQFRPKQFKLLEKKSEDDQSH